jgi:hypothetical protein
MGGDVVAVFDQRGEITIEFMISQGIITTTIF